MQYSPVCGTSGCVASLTCSDPRRTHSIDRFLSNRRVGAEKLPRRMPENVNHKILQLQAGRVLDEPLTTGFVTKMRIVFPRETYPAEYAPVLPELTAGMFRPPLF